MFVAGLALLPQALVGVLGVCVVVLVLMGRL